MTKGRANNSVSHSCVRGGEEYDFFVGFASSSCARAVNLVFLPLTRFPTKTNFPNIVCVREREMSRFEITKFLIPCKTKSEYQSIFFSVPTGRHRRGEEG